MEAETEAEMMSWYLMTVPGFNLLAAGHAAQIKVLDIHVFSQ